MIVGWPGSTNLEPVSMFRFAKDLDISFVSVCFDLSRFLRTSKFCHFRVGQVGLLAWQCILRLPKISNVSNSVSDVAWEAMGSDRSDADLMQVAENNDGELCE